jgi:wobble nucleotide-excising tRNase
MLTPLMINKIKKIKNLGLFSNYSWDSNLPYFSKYNLFYGWNGSGKTTLSKLFSSFETGTLSDFSSLEYEVDFDGTIHKEGVPLGQKIRIFNQDYIQKNVQLVSGKANPIFILGEESKEISDQIILDEELLVDIEKQKSDKESEKTRKETAKDKVFTDVARIISADFSGSASRNYRSPNAKEKFQTLTEKSVLTESEISTQRDTVKQEEKDKIQNLSFAFDLNLDSLYEETTSICAETVEINLIESLSQNPDISQWVEKGLTIHTHESEKCEFCSSIIPAGRIEKLLGHFNEADKKLKIKIDAKISEINQKIQTIKNTTAPNKAQFYTDLQSLFTSRVTSYNQERDNFFLELSNIVDTLELKKQKTTESILFTRTLNNNFQTAVISLAEIIEQHNQKSDNFQSEKDKAFILLELHHLGEVFGEINGLDQEIKGCADEILRLQNGEETGDFIGITRLKKRIQDNKGKISSEHKACDSLNEQLETFLGRKEIEFEVATEGGYHLKRSEVIAKNLSEGEKTAIAFIYFIVHLKDQDFDLANGVVVVDDPISSLDSNSLFQAFAFLKNAVKDAKQVFIFTHNFSFLKLTLGWVNHRSVRSKSCLYMIKNKYSENGNRTAFLDSLDSALRDHESEYHYLFKVLYTFQSDGSIENVYHIPNIARKVLDTFLMFRVPNGQNQFQKLEKLNFDKNKKTAIYKFTNDQSHMTGDGFDPSLVPETQKNVQYLLEMMKEVFPEHYEILEEQFSS